MSPRELSPLGTARLAIEGGAAPDAGAWPRDLLDEAGLEEAGLDALTLAWELARFTRGLGPADRRRLITLVTRSLAAVRAGSTRLPVDDDAVALLDRVPEVCGRPGETKPLLLVESGGRHLYHHKLFEAERRLAEALGPRLAGPAAPPAAAPAALADVAARPAGWSLSGEQRAAVEHALAHPLTVITGGPGTGKTSIVLSILRCLVRLGLPVGSIAIAAPTGRAAQRLGATLSDGLARVASPSAEDEGLAAALPEVLTVHRLLGTGGGRPGAILGALPHRVVIVDECSMLDLLLAARLAGALRPDARLVLLGDADQLPAVEAGAVFRDLCRNAVRLTESHRMRADDSAGRRILNAAAAVNRGDAPAVLEAIAPRSDARALVFDGVERLGGGAETREDFLDLWAERLRAWPRFGEATQAVYRFAEAGLDPAQADDVASLFQHLGARRLLTVTRGPHRAASADALCRALRRRVLPDEPTGPAVVPGEPVLVLRNDYDRGLWNGDEGLVLWVLERHARRPRPMAVFRSPAGFAVFGLEGLGTHLAPAWASTVHKAQGSELDEAALVLPDEDLPLATRELVYTALTRCRRSFVAVGDPDILARAVERRIERSTGLGEILG